jgi:hypothetical protein
MGGALSIFAPPAGHRPHNWMVLLCPMPQSNAPELNPDETALPNRIEQYEPPLFVPIPVALTTEPELMNVVDIAGVV